MIRSNIFKDKATHRVAFVLVLLMAGTLSFADQGDEKAKTDTVKKAARAYLALSDEYERPLAFEKKSFDCSEKIYAVAELSHFPKGKHEFSVRWIDPSNTTREHTRYPFHINQAETRLWSWLSLRRGTGAGMLQWLDPSAGLEEFVGPWQVEIHLDGKPLQKLTMEVNC